MSSSLYLYQAYQQCSVLEKYALERDDVFVSCGAPASDSIKLQHSFRKMGNVATTRNMSSLVFITVMPTRTIVHSPA